MAKKTFGSDAERRAAFANMQGRVNARASAGGSAVTVGEVRDLQDLRSKRAKTLDGKTTSKDSRDLENEKAKSAWAKHPGRLDLPGIDSYAGQDEGTRYIYSPISKRWRVVSKGDKDFEKGISAEDFTSLGPERAMRQFMGGKTGGKKKGEKSTHEKKPGESDK